MKGFSGAALAIALISLSTTAQAELKIFACVPEWGSLARTLGGDRVTVTDATSALDNPEAMTPTPGLVASLGQADLAVCTGAGLEGSWLPAMLDRSGNANIAEGQPGLFLAADYVKLIEEAEEEGSDEGHHAHEEGNPHIQGDPRNVQRIAAQLARRMIELDPDGEQVYAENVKAFLAGMKELITELEVKATPLKDVEIAVQHGHSLYVLNWLGIHSAATVEPEPGVAPGPQHLANVIEAVGAHGIRFIVHAPYEDPGPSRYIAERTGIPVVKLPFTVGGVPEAVDLPTFYRETVDRLLDGLNGRDRS